MPKKVPAIDPAAVGCEFCALAATWDQLRTPRMPVSGNKTDGDILVLGEAPGRQEDLRGETFIGPSGALLRKEIPSKFEPRLAFQNTVRCRPESNRTPTAAEMHACSIHLEADAERLPIKAVLCAGNVPLHRFAPELTITKAHGTPFPVSLGGKAIWAYAVFHPAYVLRNESDNSSGKVRPIFENDLKRFFKEIDKWPAPKIMRLSPDDVLVPQSLEEAQGLLGRMAGPLAVDLETNSLQPYRRNAKLLTASFSDGITTISFAIDGSSWGLKLLLDTVRNRPWVAHNCSFELSWFRFFSPGDSFLNFDDTMALARLYHERETLLSLEVLSKIHLGTNVKKVMNINSAKITNYTTEEILQYNGLDTMATIPIFHKLKDKVDKTNYKRLIGAIEATVAMELQGLPFNVQTAKQFKAVWTTKVDAQIEAIKQLQPIKAFERDSGKEFNIGSPRQLAVVLDKYCDASLPTTDKGNLSTGKEVLGELEDSVPLVRHILDYREATKLVGTYIDPVIEVPEDYPDGLLHPAYTVLLTATGRLSSNNYNIQNVPRKKNSEIRNMLEVPPGWVLLVFDYAQLEARILACATNDPVLRAGIINGRDIHSDWRHNLLRIFPDYVYRVMDMYALVETISEKDLLKAIRDNVKNQFVFASFYGSTVKSCADAMHVPYEIMQELAIQFWQEFAGVKRWLKVRREEYDKTGRMLTLTGRARYQPLAKHNEMINSPIQGTAADIVNDAMVELSAMARSMKLPHLAPRIQIHDDLSFIVPEAEIEFYVETIHPVLSKVRFPWQTVPLATEVKMGTRWGELEVIAEFSGDYVIT